GAVFTARMRVMNQKGALLVGSLIAAAAVSLCAQKAPSIWEGIFTDAQVERGKTAYTANSESWHGPFLNKHDNGVSSLGGQDFDFNWRGQTVGERFERTKKTMPPHAEGKLGDQTYLDIITYILQYNGYPTGSSELKADPETLKKIVIETQSAGGTPVQ